MVTHALVLHGDTFEHRNTLKNWGFAWHPTEKVWWRGVGSDEEQARKMVKGLRGVSSSVESIRKFQRRT